jgi:hypothetical protein
VAVLKNRPVPPLAYQKKNCFKKKSRFIIISISKIETEALETEQIKLTNTTQ